MQRIISKQKQFPWIAKGWVYDILWHKQISCFICFPAVFSIKHHPLGRAEHIFVTKVTNETDTVMLLATFFWKKYVSIPNVLNSSGKGLMTKSERSCFRFQAKNKNYYANWSCFHVKLSNIYVEDTLCPVVCSVILNLIGFVVAYSLSKC